ncbi:MAG: hypothetical protein R3190_13695, partial [Thermoanaerobaculia bacterium]|nr:hypothetical protein [Thermoanaerobaculia bacterium]
VAADGTLAYLRGEASDADRLSLLDRDGTETPLDALPSGTHQTPRLSPDGRRVAYASDDGSIYVFDRERGTRTRLTFGELDRSPLWTPDGSALVYHSREGIRRVSALGGEPTLIAGKPELETPSSFSPDGADLVLHYRTETGSFALGRIPAGGGDVEQLVAASPGSDWPALRGEVSPDGRWLAYQSRESGDDHVYLSPYPDTDRGKWQVSAEGGGMSPLWAPAGDELFYRSVSGTLMRVSVESGDTPRLGLPTELFEGSFVFDINRQYDITPEGRQFLGRVRASAEELPEIVLVVGWGDELRRLVGGGSP